MTLAGDVRDHLAARPEIARALAEGIVNHAALARRLADEMGTSKRAAIAQALRRLEAPSFDHGVSARISARDGLTLLTYRWPVEEREAELVVVEDNSLVVVGPERKEAILSRLGEPSAERGAVALITIEGEHPERLIPAIISHKPLLMVTRPGHAAIVVDDRALAGALSTLKAYQNLY